MTDPSSFLRFDWEGGQLVWLSVLPSWRMHVGVEELAEEILRQLSERESPDVGPAGLGLHLATIPSVQLERMGELAERLAVYNELRSAYLASIPDGVGAVSLSRAGGVNVTRRGSEVIGLSIEPDWAERQPAQALSEALTEALTGGPASTMPEPSAELRRAIADIETMGQVQ